MKRILIIFTVFITCSTEQQQSTLAEITRTPQAPLLTAVSQLNFDETIKFIKSKNYTSTEHAQAVTKINSLIEETDKPITNLTRFKTYAELTLGAIGLCTGIYYLCLMLERWHGVNALANGRARYQDFQHFGGEALLLKAIILTYAGRALWKSGNKNRNRIYQKKYKKALAIKALLLEQSIK